MMLQEFRAQILASLGSPAPPVAYGQGPRNQGAPYIVLWRVAGTFQVGVSGPLRKSTALMQVDVYATTYAKLQTMIDLLRLGMHGFRGGSIQSVILESVRDEGAAPDVADKIFSAQMDFSVNYTEPAP